MLWQKTPMFAQCLRNWLIDQSKDCNVLPENERLRGCNWQFINVKVEFLEQNVDLNSAVIC